MRSRISRRRFVGTSAAAAALSVVPRHVLGGPGHTAPNDKITLAHIGMGTQSIRELAHLFAEPQIQIVAVCDPNKQSNDYVEWGKNDIRNRIRRYLGQPSWGEGQERCPGGREIGRLVIEAHYATERGCSTYKGCRTYADFREMLEQETDIDAVKILTPDHTHATLAIAAMKKSINVVMHKPIANRLYEGQRVLEVARQTGVSTHLLAYGAGKGNGAIVRKIREGVIGRLREIHNWTNRPVWPQYDKIPEDRPPVPVGFDWQLWLGPERDRPYHPHYTHSVYRGWYDFGGGSMADMGIYSLWPVFVGLELDSPLSAQAWATHTCAIVDHVSRPVKNDFAYPIGCTLRFKFAARKDMPPVDLFWYDGGMKPRLPAELEAQDVQIGREGIMFIGDEGTILAGFQGQNPRLFAKGGQQPLVLSADAEPNEPANPWLAAFQGQPSPGTFLNAGPITDTVNLGTVALRAGQKVEFDAHAMKITNLPGAEKYLYREYREGWEL